MAGIGGGANFCGHTCAMEDRRDPQTRVWLTMLTVLGVSGATVAGLWLVSYYCLSQPSSPLNLSDWECGAWSGWLAMGILVAGGIVMSVAWRALSRRR